MVPNYLVGDIVTIKNDKIYPKLKSLNRTIPKINCSYKIESIIDANDYWGDPYKGKLYLISRALPYFLDWIHESNLIDNKRGKPSWL